MIIREKPRAWELLFLLRGSIFPRIAFKLAAVTLLSLLAAALEATGTLRLPAVAALPFSLIGIALSVFAGFRNSACYDRWWEARKVLGQLVIDCRSLARQALVQAGPAEPAVAGRMARRCIAFAHALRDHLRAEPLGTEALEALDPDEALLVAGRANPPNVVLLCMSHDIASLFGQNRISAQSMQVMEERVVSLTGVLAAGERIKATPVPFTYSLLMHRTATLFCLLLPFGLVPTNGAWTPLLVAIVSYTFFGLDALGDELEAPFGRGPNALPLDAIARTVEINIREMLGEPDLPPELAPVNHVLH